MSTEVNLVVNYKLVKNDQKSSPLSVNFECCKGVVNFI